MLQYLGFVAEMATHIVFIPAVPRGYLEAQLRGRNTIVEGTNM